MLVCATLYSLFWSGVLVYVFFTITAQGETARTLATTIAEQATKEAAAETTSQIIESTATERDTLSNFFVSEADTISFLAMIESTARDVSVSLETTELAVIEKTETKPAALRTSFRFEGSEAAVGQFLRALETLPYHSNIPELSINLNKTGWEGSLSLLTTITP